MGFFDGAFNGLMSLFGSGASALIASSGSKGSQARAYNYQRMLQQQQYDLQQQGLREGYTNARQGLEKAGMNPILAATSGYTYPSVSMGGVGTDSPNIPDFGNTMSNAYQTFKLNKQSVNNQTLQTLTQSDLSNAQAGLAREQAVTEQTKRNNIEVNTQLQNVEKQLKQKDLSWYDRRQLVELKSMLQNAQANSASAAASQVNAKANLQNAQTNSAQFKNTMEANRLNSEWIARHPHQASFLTGVNNWTKSISPWTTGHTVINRYDANGNFKGQIHSTTGRGRARK